MSTTTEERVFDWNDEIERDGGDYILLPEGDYYFTVSAFERARHEGSAKLPPCPKAIVTLTIDTPEGTAAIKHNLFLHSRCEGLLSAFFVAIGQKKHGERLKMDWGKVVGSAGRCKVGIHRYTKKDGSEGESNEIKKFYDPEDTESKSEQPAVAFTKGKF